MSTTEAEKFVMLNVLCDKHALDDLATLTARLEAMTPSPMCDEPRTPASGATVPVFRTDWCRALFDENVRSILPHFDVTIWYNEVLAAHASSSLSICWPVVLLALESESMKYQKHIGQTCGDEATSSSTVIKFSLLRLLLNCLTFEDDVIERSARMRVRIEQHAAHVHMTTPPVYNKRRSPPPPASDSGKDWIAELLKAKKMGQ